MAGVISTFYIFKDSSRPISIEQPQTKGRVIPMIGMRSRTSRRIVPLAMLNASPSWPLLNASLSTFIGLTARGTQKKTQIHDVVFCV